MSYQEFDPYGNPTDDGLLTTDYGFTGEWWEEDVELLHLRARWYLPSDGVFLSRDPVESEPPYQYVRGNPINAVDPSGYFPPLPHRNPGKPFIGDYKNSNLATGPWAAGPCSDWTGMGFQGWVGKQACLLAFNGNEWAMEQIFRQLAAMEVNRGWPEAGRALNHFLDGTGTNLFFSVGWLFTSAKNPATGKSDIDYYDELKKRIRNYAVAHRGSAFFWNRLNSTPLTERDGSSFNTFQIRRG